MHRAVTSQSDWPSYNGQNNGSRHSVLSQITAANVSRVVPRWIFGLQNTSRLQVTPVVVGGVMYVDQRQRVLRARRGHGPGDLALPAAAHARAWSAMRPAVSTAASASPAIACSWSPTTRTSSRSTASAGALLWETEMADWHQNYNATGAPLPIGRLVVTGSSGGDEGVRGFVAAFDQETGKEVWRFWTVPARGEPKSETWQGSGHRSSRRDDVADRHLRSRARHDLLAGRQSGSGS